MKIRFDFVTNSSSSSFVAFNIKNKELAKACRKFWIPCGNDGTTVSGVWEAENSHQVVGTPGGGSIAQWFETMLDPKQNYVWQLYGEDFSNAIDYISAHRQEIDEATERSEIASADVVTDGDGTGVAIEIREKGVIKSFGVDEYDWDYKEMGEALWQVLQGCVMESFLPQLKRFAESRGEIRESRDFWYKEVSNDSIFDSLTEEVSLSGKKCCLTGDFKYGPKESVERYITGKGGSVSSSVTKSTQILVVGALGSDAWVHNNYGRKVEKAMELRAQGKDIIIVSEDDFFADTPSLIERSKSSSSSKPDPKDAEKRQQEIDKYYRDVDREQRINAFYKGYEWIGDRKIWLRVYGNLIDKIDFIDLNGKNVVLSGHHPVYYKLNSLGAVVKNDSRIGGSGTSDNVTKKTDYLVVEPNSSSYGKVETVIELRRKGNTRVKVILADDLAELIDSGRYYSKAMAEEDARKKADELKKRVDTELDENKLGYGILAIMMTCLKVLPADTISLKDRLNIEELIISQQMENLLGTHLNDLLTVYGGDSTEKLIDCAKHVKTDMATTEMQINAIRTSFDSEIQALDAFLDKVIITIKEA